MNSWKDLKPTNKQLIAISEYGKYYGIELQIYNKQEAHELISVFCPHQKLTFKNGFVSGTNIRYLITDSKKFSKHIQSDRERLKNVVKIRVENGISYITIREKSISTVLGCLQNNMDRLLNEVSYSEYEDSLGYLNEMDLNEEMDSYGVDPILSGVL